jgi:hypothetical protein
MDSPYLRTGPGTIPHFPRAAATILRPSDRRHGRSTGVICDHEIRVDGVLREAAWSWLRPAWVVSVDPRALVYQLERSLSLLNAACSTCHDMSWRCLELPS